MSRTRARFTQADVARTIRAARQAGAAAVEVRPDGTIWVALTTTSSSENTSDHLDQDHKIEL